MLLVVDAPCEVMNGAHTPGAAPLEPDEGNFEQLEVAGLSQSQIVRRRFFRHRGAMAALIHREYAERPRHRL